MIKFMMPKIGILATTIIILSCGIMKGKTDDEPDYTKNYARNATGSIKNEACAPGCKQWLLIWDAQDIKLPLYILDMPDSLKVEGLKISFDADFTDDYHSVSVPVKSEGINHSMKHGYNARKIKLLKASKIQ